jgi:quercetin dioxygenase-like cupin family protein
MDAIVFQDSDGEVYEGGGARMRILAQAPGQSIAVIESTVPPGFPGPVLHRHTHVTDIFYVLDGCLTFDLEGERRVLGPGSFVIVPPGVAHTFGNPESKPARLLNIFQPAGLATYLKEAFMRMANGHPWSPIEMAEIAAQYDFSPAVDMA